MAKKKWISSMVARAKTPGSARVLARALAPLVRVWSASLRYQLVHAERFSALYGAGPLVAALWHDELFPFIALHGRHGMACVVSQSWDGELLARVLVSFGFGTARGSSSRGGVKALRAALRQREGGSGVVLTVDGPRGPRHVAKPGAGFVARALGARVLPVRAFMHPVVTFASWDRFQLPLPCARCTIVYGEPLAPPAAGEDLDAYSQRLTAALEAIAMPSEGRDA
jgi:hypothetical protein